MTINSKILTGIYTVALSLAFATPVLATDTVEVKDTDETETALDTEQTRVTRLTQADDNEDVIEEVIILGTRVAGRVSTDLPVAVDAFSNACSGDSELAPLA